MAAVKGMTKAGLLVMLLVAVLAFAYSMKVKPLLSAANSATAFAARQSCSLHLAAGLPLEWALATYVHPEVQPFNAYLEVTVEPRASSTFVRASLNGWLQAEAMHRPGFGCTLLRDQPLARLPSRVRVSAPVIRLARRARSEGFRPKPLRRAVRDAFAEPDPSAPRHTLAVMVLHNGKLVAEQYAPGIKQATPLPGLSMTNSMTATLLGLLVQHKGLSVETTMSRGNASNPESRHVDSTVRARLFQQHAGNNDPSLSFEFLRQHLLKPMRLQSLQLELDAAGTLLGASSMLASTLDWAKLGQLYLQDGLWQDQRLLPKGWANYVRQATNDGVAGQYRNLPWLPEDAFLMRGRMNQAVFVLPSQSLVIVRLGATRNSAQSGERQLIADVIASMR